MLNKGKRTPQSSFKKILLSSSIIGYVTILIWVIYFIIVNHSATVERIVASNKQWLSIYSESFISDFQLGNLLAVEKNYSI